MYILLLILFIPFAFSDVFVNDYDDRARHGIVVAEFPHQKVRGCSYVVRGQHAHAEAFSSPCISRRCCLS